DGDQIVDAGYDGCGLISKTVADLKLTSFAFIPVEYPLIQKAPEYGDGWVRFAQTYGGRTHPCRARSAGHRSSRSWHRWCGRPSHRPSTPTAGPSTASSEPARSPATGSMTTTATW